MSFQAMSWATEQELPAMQKIVLLMLANRTNHDTGLCFPSHDTLTKECGMSKRSVVYQIEKLEEAKLLTVIRSTNAKGEKNANRYKLNLKGGSATDALGVVQQMHGGSATDAHKPVTEPKSVVVVTHEGGILDLTQEQSECKNWASSQNYWASCTQSNEEFLKVWCKPNGALRKQFNAHKKTLQDGRGQTGLNVQTQNNTTRTGVNYATHYANNKKPTAAQIAQSLRERANAASNDERIAYANTEILVRND
jgi:hypothetical protein